MLCLLTKNKKMKKIALPNFAPAARGRILDAVLSAALTLKTLNLTDCNRRWSSGKKSSHL